MSLLFGIPTLDELVEIPESNELSEPRGAFDSTSMSLLGPDGSGKSVLSLHLASNYAAWCCANLPAGAILPKILYVSSDLQFESASKIWSNFDLGQPRKRHIPFERMPAEITRRKILDAIGLKIELKELEPGGRDEKSEVKFLLDAQHSDSELAEVGFLDLAYHTAGDDWHFLNSLIVNLQAFHRPKCNIGGKEVELNHLVIIDSVAGFETLMGAVDAYGLEQSRRARIAQTMRNAHEHAHLVFVVEEPDAGKRLPEEYVTDIVIRLRTRRDAGRPIRTVEVEKARARNHATGEHVFEIRNRKGSSTGQWENADTPATNNNYVHVYFSLSHRNLLTSSKYGKERNERVPKVQAFGLPYLDGLLERIDSNGNPSWGVASGTTAGLIGDSGTGKSLLGEKFLAGAFGQLAEDLLNLYFLLERGRKDESNTVLRICQLLEVPCLGRLPLSGTAPANAESPKDPWAAIEASWRKGLEKSEVSLELGYPVGPKSGGQEIGTFKQRQEVLEKRKLTSPGNLPKTRSSYYADLTASPLHENSLIERLRSLFRHPNLRSPAILLTTGDRTADLMAFRFLGYLLDTLKRYPIQEKCSLPVEEKCELPEILKLLVELIEEQLIVRRFDIDNITGAALFDTVQRNIVVAQYLVHGPFFPPDQLTRSERSDRIRVVFDDMRVLSNLCPSVTKDSAFLPLLVFYLEREGVTTLMVHTDELRPGERPDDAISQELISLLKQQVLTWSVPFEGQSRIAITAIPASSKETNGIVREVEVRRVTERPHYIPAHFRNVIVTRHLELYADLESGKPRLVPLAVYLFAATPACRKYIDNENFLFRTQFLPLPGLVRNDESARVIWPVDASEYYAIRDVIHLPWDVKADHTIVDQVDGFWSLDYPTGSLASQQEYLIEASRTEHDDSFGLFRGTPLWGPVNEAPPYPRRRYFKNSNYESRIFNFSTSSGTVSGMPDRIPFMWDFGFMLVQADPWERAAEQEVFYSFRETKERFNTFKSVDNVLKELLKPSEMRKVVPWRTFLGACRGVAEQARKERGVGPIAFDFAATSAETLLSLVLEIWFSEISLIVETDPKIVDSAFKDLWLKWLPRLTSTTYEPLLPGTKEAAVYSMAQLLRQEVTTDSEPIRARFSEFRQHYIAEVIRFYSDNHDPDVDIEELQRWGNVDVIRQNYPDNIDLSGITNAVEKFDRANETFREESFKKLPTAALCLYKSWLLLQDVFDFESIHDPSNAFEIQQPKIPSESAVAVRHYYRTACHSQSERPANTGSQPQYALAMPGSFSVRGDTFLASARASRSQLLASEAIDLLCSRRGNLSRMQLGIGLPVRDVLANDQCKQMRTALRTKKEHSLEELRYGDLCSLGGPPPGVAGEQSRSQWLFRNGMPDYDRTSRAMLKWLARLAHWTISYRAKHVLNWDGGFHGYDALTAHRFSPFVTFSSFDEFSQHCDYLIAELDAAERGKVRSEPKPGNGPNEPPERARAASSGSG